jgi:antitoxin PrlF
MATATMTSKGQVTIPAEIRAKLRLVPGSKISFEDNADGETVVRAKMGDVRSLKGFFKYDGPPKSIDEINEGIAQAAAEGVLRSFK